MTKNGALKFTYGDVTLVPGHLGKGTEFDTSIVLCKDMFGNDIKLNVPFMTAAMDTVTEANMAIAISREGGIGVIHVNMSPEEQARQVGIVKHAANAMIENPIVVYPDTTIGEAIALREQHGFGYFPVIDQTKKILGLVTALDIRFQEENHNEPIINRMTTDPVIVSIKEVANPDTKIINLDKAKKIFAKHKTKTLLVASRDNILLGLITSKDVENTKIFPNACKDIKGRYRVAAAVATTPDVIQRVKLLVNADVDMVCIDSAHGHSDYVSDTIRAIKKVYPLLPVVGGNVVTTQSALFLAKAGADFIKVGVGPGAICTTRIISGFGVPQFSAVNDVAQTLKKNGYKNIKVIADGGLTYSGDIVKAIVAGADAVMMGGMFAGTEESPGKTRIYQGRKVKEYRGMGSIEAMREGSKNRYGINDDKKLISEGIVSYVDYKGTVAEVTFQYAGGLRAGMKYAGAPNLKTLKTAKWVRITQAGVIESHPHNVTKSHDQPNY